VLAIIYAMRPWLKATLQGAVVSAVSNILGQLVEARQESVSCLYLDS
jgi:hypothetical protein